MEPNIIQSKNGFQPDVGYTPIDCHCFATSNEAFLVTSAWIAASENGMSVNDFIHSIPFLFRMYGFNNAWAKLS